MSDKPTVGRIEQLTTPPGLYEIACENRSRLREELRDAKDRIAELEAALREIVKPQYGLQGIIEDYGQDTNAENYHARKYYELQVERATQTARRALEGK